MSSATLAMEQAAEWKWSAVVKGTVLGGIILFAWGAISWMALPWRESTILPFTNESGLAQVIVAGAPRSGMYMLPSAHRGDNAAQAAAQEQMMKGPMVFASVRLGPMGSMGGLMATQVAIQLASALLATILLLHARPMAYGGRVLFVVGIALAVGVAGHLPEWNWWSFSAGYTMLDIADLVIGWGLAGLVIAKVAR